MHEPGAETIGYKLGGALPRRGDAEGPGKPVDLTLTMEFGICREICIPAEAKFCR